MHLCQGYSINIIIFATHDQNTIYVFASKDTYVTYLGPFTVGYYLCDKEIKEFVALDLDVHYNLL